MKLLKITFEYDKEIRWLEGKEAEKWLEASNNMAVLEHIHGRPFPQFNWQIKKKGKNK